MNSRATQNYAIHKPVKHTLLLALFLVLSGAGVLAVPPSSTDLWDIHSGAVVTATSGIYPSSDVRDMFGGAFASLEPTSTLFADGHPEGFVHFIEWKTLTPVTVKSIQLFAAGDGPIYNN